MGRSLEIMEEVCVGLPHRVQRMFGGHGFFAPNGGMFAGIVTDDEVVLKLTYGPARDELIALGGHPWVYDGKGKAMTMQEWIVVPPIFYDDFDLFTHWLRRALELAPPKKLTSKQAATGKQALVKKVTAKKTSGKKAPVKKTTAKKTTGKPTPVKKASAKKAPLKKTV
jgi:TfoX/Sxy family transcriptional regulator of competence genes